MKKSTPGFRRNTSSQTKHKSHAAENIRAIIRMSSRQETACNNCRKQKLKCSGQRPICQRCDHLGKHCLYVDKPARRARPTRLQQIQVDHGLAAPATKDRVAVPPELMPRLAEKFFTHFHLATFLAHKTTFMSDLAAGRVPEMLLLSVAAIAARYCDPIPSERELIPRLRGRQWAEQASHLAMLSLDHSSITTVRSLILCSMYWFASGDSERAHIQSGIASRLVQNLELYNAPDLGAQEVGAQDVGQELNLRTFWVTWLTEIYGTLRRRHNVHPLVEQAINRSLPCSEEEFISKWRKSNTTFLLKDLDGSGSVLAELMRAADLWLEVSLFINRHYDTIGAQVLGLQNLDSLGRKWYTSFSRQLQYSPETFRMYAQLDIGPAFIFVHILYHTSMAVLYYSLVLATASKPEQSTSVPITILTSSALEHTNHISAIIENLLGPLWDVSKTPPFTTYAAYVATSIQLAYVWSRFEELATTAQNNVQLNLRLLDACSPYWMIAESTAGKARLLCDIYTSQNPERRRIETLTLAPASDLKQIAPMVLLYGQTLWDSEGRRGFRANPEEGPTPSTSPEEKPLSSPDTLGTTLPSPLVERNPFNYTHNDEGPVAVDPCALFPHVLGQDGQGPYLSVQSPSSADAIMQLWSSIVDTGVASLDL